MSLKQPKKIRVDFDDLEEGDETAREILTHNGQLFTGYAVIGYHPDGTIESEEEFRNGIMMGWVNQYYSDGTIRRETLCFMSLQNSLAFYTYGTDGQQIGSHLLVSSENYNAIVSEYRLLD